MYSGIETTARLNGGPNRRSMLPPGFQMRTLTATGASSFTRRELTAATAFALALGGAVLGTVAAYVAAVGYAWDNPLDGLSGLSSVPARQLLIICVGMPVVAAVVGWLLAGREPPVISRQPLE